MRGVAEPCAEAGDAAGADEVGENLIEAIRIYKWFGANFHLFIYLDCKIKMVSQIGLC